MNVTTQYRYCLFLAASFATADVLTSNARAQRAAAHDGTTTGTQWWKGTIEIPSMPPIDCIVAFRPSGIPGEYEATLDIPSQGAIGLVLQDVELTDTRIAFTIGPPTNAIHTLERSSDGKTATGTLRQHGMTFPMRMERITEALAKTIGPDRPQTPKPPFPYGQREVRYTNPTDGAELAGTLTVPAGQGPHPAVLLITGSGAQDRDETIFGHKPFLVIADHLSRNGIAVLRVDDRGVGGSSGASDDLTSEDFAGDVRAGMDFLERQSEIDRSRIALMGHSEGGIIAPLVASASKDVACIVLLAGSGLPGGRILHAQNEALLRASGVSPDRVHTILAAYDAVLAHVADSGSRDALRPFVRTLIEAQIAAQPTASPNPPSTQHLDQLTNQALTAFTLPWMRWFIAHDPGQTLRRVRCPVLALGGSLDLQVAAKENLAAISNALREGGNNDVTVREFPGLNHLFQKATLGTVKEYATISQTMAPAVLDEITTWLRTRFHFASEQRRMG